MFVLKHYLVMTSFIRKNIVAIIFITTKEHERHTSRIHKERYAMRQEKKKKIKKKGKRKIEGRKEKKKKRKKGR